MIWISKPKLDKSVWHNWFAWYPVCVRRYTFAGFKYKRWAWWEFVQRRIQYGYTNTKYYREAGDNGTY